MTAPPKSCRTGHEPRTIRARVGQRAGSLCVRVRAATLQPAKAA